MRVLSTFISLLPFYFIAPLESSLLACCSGERHLGYRRHSLVGVSFYHLLHPDSMRELQAKHRLGRLFIIPLKYH